MEVAIVGFGWDGQAAWRYWSKLADKVLICDQNPDIETPKGAETQLGDGYLNGLEEYDLVVRFQGMRREKILDANPGLDPEKVINSTDEFFRVAPTSNIIGVTGTKGKGTTTTLIARILEEAGERVHVGGNIGTPALDLLPDIQENDWVVLELSSFQLFDIHHSPHIAVCLMITPDHMDWHTDMEEYVTAKSRIFAYQSTSDVAVYNADNADASRVAEESPGRKIAYSVQKPADIRVKEGAVYAGTRHIIDVSDIGLRGSHNQENVCAATGAAIAALRELRGSSECPDIHVPEDVRQDLHAVIRDFHGLEHRLEFVATKQGVSFYNDSFSTNPIPTIAAIHSFSEPEILILGGSGKGADFSELAQEIVNSNVKHVVVIGDESPRIIAALDSAGFTDYSHGGETMPEILEEALQHTKEGQAVLLSPACASFGLFESYKDRGKRFKEAVARRT